MQLIGFEGDDYHAKTARTQEDEEQVFAGFDYVRERIHHK